MNGNLIGIIIALLGVAGGIWTQVVQFKKDAQRVDGVNSTAGDIKADTSEMKPKVENIDRNCNIMREDITRNVLPQMKVVSDIQSGLQELIEAKHFDDKIKDKISASVDNPAYIINGVNLIYENNAKLEMEKRELINEKFQLQAKIQILQSENARLLNELTLVKENVRQLKGIDDVGISR